MWDLFAVDPETALEAPGVSEPEAWMDRLSVTDRLLVAFSSSFPGIGRAIMRVAEPSR